jgi:ribosomal protein S18 acetylase RimI-like enzyme
VARVRRAGRGDDTALTVLIQEFYDIDGHVFDQATVAAGLLPLLTDDTYGQVWIVEDEGRPVGYAVVTWGFSIESGGRDALLDEIYVRRRGEGIGQELLRHAMAEASKAGASCMFLETEAHNVRVRGFYSRLGFAVEESFWMSARLT